MFKPSAYQEAIFEAIHAGTGDLVVEAVAGSGKTTTLVEAGKRLPTGTSALFCAFNKAIADTLATRLNGSGVEAKTLHSLGKQALERHLGSRTKVEGRKPYKLIDKYIRYHHADLIRSQNEDRLYLTDEGRLVQEAMLKLLDFCRLTLTPPDDHAALIQMCLHYEIDLEDRALDALPWLITQDEETARRAYEIDFTDMIWLPVKWNIPMPTYQWVFVDESQDLNKCQLEMVLKCRQPGGRMVFVGDRSQAIYFFAGADDRSIPNIIERTQAQTLPLSINYRCPTSVLKLAQEVVPHIEARPDAPEGAVIQIPSDKLVDTAQPGDMILCRLTAPLISECINFIKHGVPARVEGRDIGKQLTQIVDKVALRDRFTYDTFLVHLNGYRIQQVQMLVDKDADPTQITSMEDRCDAVGACYEDMDAKDLDDLKAKIESLFAEERPKIKLATIHRAKGLEAPRVFIIAPEKLPLQVSGPQMAQEYNLRYVAVTRAQETLFVVGGTLSPGPYADGKTPPPIVEKTEITETILDPQVVSPVKLSETEPTVEQPVAKPLTEERPQPKWVIKPSKPVNTLGSDPPKYRYGMCNRPAGYGTCPEGWSDERESNEYSYGTIAYERRLTPEELTKWEMEPVSANAYTYPVGAHVLVHEVDEARVEALAPRGRYNVRYASTNTTETVGVKDLEPFVKAPVPAKPPKAVKPTKQPALDALDVIEKALVGVPLPPDIPSNVVGGAVALLRLVLTQPVEK